MWSLALMTLVTSTVTAWISDQCPQYFEPLNKTMKRLKMDGPMVWDKVNSACLRQFPGHFEMLHRDLLLLSDEDKELCRGQSVPLWMRKIGVRTLVWPSSEFLDEQEDVNATYLARMGTKGMVPTNSSDLVGSLDLSTGQWRLVDKTTHFTCAICQRAYVKVFGRPREHPPLFPSRFQLAYTFGVENVGNDSVGVDDAIRTVNLLNYTVKRKDGTPVSVDAVKWAGNESDQIVLRMRVSSVKVGFDEVVETLNGSFSVKSWRDMHECPAERVDGVDWSVFLMGRVQSFNNSDHKFHHIARRCGWKKYPDRDVDAVWDDVVHWIDRWQECNSLGYLQIIRQLHDYAKRADLDNGLDLVSLLKITANITEIRLSFEAMESFRNDLTGAFIGALSALVASNETYRRVPSACKGHACAILAEDLQGKDMPEAIQIYSKYEQPNILKLNELNSKSETTLISLNISQAIAAVEGRVAVHILHSDISTNFAPIVYVTDFDYSMLAHVVTTLPFDETVPKRSRPALIFRVSNPGVRLAQRYVAVCSLGMGDGSAESSLPCPWIYSDLSGDVYQCNNWARGPRNFTAGTFLAGTGDVYADRVLNANHVLLGYTTVPIDESGLAQVTKFTNIYVLETFENDNTNLKHSVETMNPIEEILSGVILNEYKENLEHVKVLVSNLSTEDPVVGVSFKATSMQTVTASSRNDVSAETEVDLVLGGSVQQYCQQLAILAVTDVERLNHGGSLGMYVKRKLMVVYLVLTSKSSSRATSESVYLDIHILGEVEEAGEEKYDELHDVDDNKDADTKIAHEYNMTVKSKLRFQVATWSAAKRDWQLDTTTCFKLRSTRALKSVVRCERLTFANNQFRASYLIFEPVTFAEAFGTPLLAVLIAAGFLSGVSLASIAGTAASLPVWRKDLGHKILLQMTLALSFNLALGFTSSFVSLDTASVACVAVGALRHFSYLAMFAWMLVMSGLQLRRLLSMLGARNTPKLLLKVSFFAWGVPFAVIASLLTLNMGMYQSDTADRGYCYPEGTAFAWSVQAPAATVLTLNVAIFAVILARLYGFRGWGETEGLQRHLKTRTLQMRRLKAVFYTFCLFGITWLFHLMAEQGVFQDKFLYEYLFLMTASVHLFSLSCIFVFFDPEARTEWAQVVASVLDR